MDLENISEAIGNELKENSLENSSKPTGVTFFPLKVFENVSDHFEKAATLQDNLDAIRAETAQDIEHNRRVALLAQQLADYYKQNPGIRTSPMWLRDP